MAILDYTFEALGIFVSVLLFFEGYRRSIGVRKEWARSANDAIERVLLRRLVREEQLFTSEEIARMIDTKSRDFRVRPGHLLSEEQFLNNVYTRVAESDFIAAEQRKQYFRLLSASLEKANENLERQRFFESTFSRSSSRWITSTIMQGSMAIVASLVGTVLTALLSAPQMETGILDFLPELAITAAVSLALIGFLITFFRFRDRQQEQPNKEDAISSYIQFERKVLREFHRVGLNPEEISDHRSRDKGYDFSVRLKEKRVLVEAKNWGHGVPIAIIDKVKSRLDNALNEENADEALLVTPRERVLAQSPEEQGHLKVMSLRQLRAYLKREL